MQYYQFKFTYGNGDYYNGYGYANDGTYTNSQTWVVVDENGQNGNYKITYAGFSSNPVTDIGKIYVDRYYDSESNQSFSDYTYDSTHSLVPNGTANLGSEHGTLFGSTTIGAFGKDAATGRQMEADIDESKVVQYYNFKFTYGNGDYYQGYGYANLGTYINNQTWTVIDENGQTGNYIINYAYMQAQAATEKGKVIVNQYYDSESGQTISPDYDSTSNGYAGLAGLGSEHGTLFGSTTIGAFGKDAATGKQMEADVDPSKVVQYYNFKFTYGNGDYYQGYGYANIGTYANNQTWTVVDENGQTGSYTITNAYLQAHAATDKGKVYVNQYYDSESGQSFSPDYAYDPLTYSSAPNGTANLGSEHGTIQGNNTFGAFGKDAATGQQLEADILMRYGFSFTYGNGDRYNGQAYALAGSYSNGQSWTVTDENNQTGTYRITGVTASGNTTVGEVVVDSYFDVETGQTVYTDNATVGTTGLGNERGTILGNATLGAFGKDAATGKQLEADINTSQALQVYNFSFAYANGDRYQGLGYANVGTYAEGQTWTVADENGQNGTYLIGWTSTEALGVHTAADKGKVLVWSYYDAETNQTVTPDGYSNGGAYNGVSGTAGLGSERDTILGDTTLGAFGHDAASGKQLEADAAANIPVQAYRFTFNYANGDSYTGNGFANTGTYSQNQTWTVVDENNQTGRYTIDWVAEGDTETAYQPADRGKVYVESYYDAETDQWLVPDGFANGGAGNGVSGTAGLGSERDTILANATLGAFGRDAVTGKQLEADVNLATAVERYDFTFTYGNGDAYSGRAYATPGTYTLGQSWTVVDENGQTGTYQIETVGLTVNPVADKGKVFVTSYFDVETDQTVTPDNASAALGAAGLGSERGSLLGNASLGGFGLDTASGKRLEADIDLNTTAQTYTFTFTYGNGDYYQGHGFAAVGTYSNGQNWEVADENGQTGTYTIDSVGLQAQPAADKGKVYVDRYYDMESALTLTPDNAATPAGTVDLGSEHGVLQGNATLGTFGFDAVSAKQLEADVAFNHAPAGTDKTVAAVGGNVYTITAADFGFTDPGDTPAHTLLAVKITTLPGAGLLKLNGVAVTAGQLVSATDIAANKLTFTPAASGGASFTFQVRDNGGTPNGGVDLDPTANRLTFSAVPINDAPTGADKLITALEDTAYTLQTADFGFADPNDSPANTLLAVKITALPAAGTLKVNGVAVTVGQSVSAADITANKLVYAPAANGNGAAYANFKFQVQDNGGTANGGVDLDPTANTVTFNVTAVRDDLNLTGTAGNDTLNGDLIDAGSYDTLSGLAGDDTLNGLGGNDTLLGGAGNDTLNGGNGVDTLVGGDGNDVYYVDNAGDAVSETNADAASGGSDMVGSYLAAYTLGANVENLRILAAGVANGTGNTLNNVIYAGAGANVLDGLAGNDMVSYAFATAGVTASLGLTTAQATGSSGSDTLLNFENLEGSGFNDGLTGNSAANTLSGGAGNDTLNGGAGADTLIGGDGSDTYYVDNAGDVVSETNAAAAGGADMVYSYLTAYTLGANVENLRIVVAGAANGTGNALANVIYAGAGDNTLDGAAGVDTVSYAYAAAGVTARLGLTAAQATGGSGSDTLLNFENLTGSAFNDALTGNSAANTLSGGAGNDALNGGAGADTLIGGDGSDTYYVDNAGDVVSETNANAATGGADTVYSYLAAYTLATNVENLRIIATGAANGTGNSLANIIYAGAGNNVLDGAAGVDTASFAYATAGVTASLGLATAQATGSSGSDTLLNFENLNGSGFNDTLIGSGAANTLVGGAGDDSLTGGAGKDTLSGGLGADTFKYGAAADSGITAGLRDIIQDFNAAQGDKIDLSGLDANSGVAADQAFGVFAQGAAFSGSFAAQASLFFDQTAHVLYGNNDADAQADFAIELVGVSSLTAAAFVL